MIGISFFISNDSKLHKVEALKKEPWHKFVSAYKTERCELCYSCYEGYPIESWKVGSFVIVYEGCIYNIEHNNIVSKLNEIAQTDEDHVFERISSFVKQADGDFIVTILNTHDKSCVMFNDELGGMSAFYHFSESEFLFSRSFATIVENVDKLEFSKENLAEYVTFGYNLGSHTICDEIYKLTPGSCLIIQPQSNELCKKEITTVSADFSTRNQYKSKSEAIADLSQIFLESCRKRVEFAQKNGYEIVNTMSGGFDSRAVLIGLEKYAQNYTNLTFEYKRDESSVVKKVLGHIESHSDYVKMSFNNVPNMDAPLLTYKTDGRVECYTNSVCYNDMQYVRHYFPDDKKILLFGGFGGEFIRHPSKAVLYSPKEWGYSRSPSIKYTSRLFNCKEDLVSRSIYDVLSPNVRFGSSAIARFVYNEYYQNYVRCSGEERSRMFFQTVQPMMSKDFILAIRNRVPLSWPGYRFFCDFLKALDKRSTEVEIFANVGKLDIFSKKSLWLKDIKSNCKLISYIRYLQRRYTHYELKMGKSTIDYELLLKYYNKIQEKNIIDIGYLNKHYSQLGRAVHLRLLTLLQFIYECESRKTNG